MSGVVFLVSVPTENHEKSMLKKSASNSKCKDSLHKNNATSIKTPSRPLRKSFTLNKRNASAGSFSPAKYGLVKSKSMELPAPLNENRKGSVETQVSFKEDDEEISMEQGLKTILETLKIDNISWTSCKDQTFWQVTFPSEAGRQCEEILKTLNEYGIGHKLGSVVCVIPCNLFYHNNLEEEKNSDEKVDDTAEKNRMKEKNTAWNRFMSSIRARLTVAQLVESIKSDAELTFDYVCLLVIATIICAIGLVEGSSMYLLSSMLISPMMGPVMAATFGKVIRDTKLQKIGVGSALFGLLIATMVGFCCGSVICIFCDRYGENDWPTQEMVSTGEIRTLRIECLIALLSGAAIALGILADNISSLVGVAISTSLMPPAVNAGLLWSMASVYSIKRNFSSVTPTSYYSNDSAIELTVLGGMSMCLSFVNIICIYIAGILVFKIKEVAPISSKDHAKRRFWTHDIKIARDYNRTFQNDDASTLYQQLHNELNYRTFPRHLQMAVRDREARHHSTDYIRENTNVDIGKPLYTWSPSTMSDDDKKTIIQDIEHVYTLMEEQGDTFTAPVRFAFPTRRKQSRTWIANTNLFERKYCEGTSSQQGLIIDMPNSDEDSEKSLNPKCNTENHKPKNFFTRQKKFVVTPCATDPLIKK